MARRSDVSAAGTSTGADAGSIMAVVPWTSARISWRNGLVGVTESAVRRSAAAPVRRARASRRRSSQDRRTRVSRPLPVFQTSSAAATRSLARTSRARASSGSRARTRSTLPRAPCPGTAWSRASTSAGRTSQGTSTSARATALAPTTQGPCRPCPSGHARTMVSRRSPPGVKRVWSATVAMPRQAAPRIPSAGIRAAKSNAL